MAKPKTHITDPTKDAPEGAAWTLCGLFVLREQVDTADPSCKKCLRAANKELKSRDKGPLTRPGSPVIAPLNPGQLGR